VSAARARRPKLAFAPLTPERWPDFESLFGANGACGGCWCMLNRVPRARFEAHKGAGNRRALRALVDSGRVPGILAYAGGEAVAWCSLEPRERFPGLARSRVARAPDERPAWCITCLFVRRDWRGRGISVALLEAAARHARASGAQCLDGFPVIPKTGAMPAAFAWTGIASAYESAGFREVARPAPSRPTMRRELRRR
jgi:GNAT superfamily N-acetyltransferase